MQAGALGITVGCLGLCRRHMKPALRSPSAHYFVFINITLAGAQNPDPLTAEKVPLNTLIPAWSAAQSLLTFTQTLNDNGLSTTGVRFGRSKTLLSYASLQLRASFMMGRSACQEDTFRRCYRPMPPALAD